MNTRSAFVATMLAVSLLALAGWVDAQTSNGTIVGTLTDQTGAVIQGATIQVIPAQGGETRSAVTDTNGSYRFESLLPGLYTLTAELKGFSKLRIDNIEVKASLVTVRGARLEVGPTETVVAVNANAEQPLQTQTGELSHSIGQIEITQLPISDLNPIKLVLTEPGVQDGNGRSFSNGFGFSVNGTRPRANNFLMDGQDNNDNSIAGQAYQPTNLAAVGEVVVLTNSYSAEFGRGGGSVTNVITKSGTNQFHGSAFELANNSALRAIPAEDKLAGVTQNPVDVENIFGYSIGGPIKKDRLFFFHSIQWDKDRSTANGRTLRIPTASGIATLQSLLPNPNVKFLLDSLGGMVGTDNSLVNVALGNGRPSVPFGLVQRSGVSERSDNVQWNYRVDFQATKDDTLTIRHFRSVNTLTPDFFNYNSALPPYDTFQGGPSSNFGFTWARVMSSRSVNELRWSYGSFDYTFGLTPATAANPLSALPAVTIANISSLPTFGENSAFPQGRGHKTWQFQDAYSITLGRHSLKVGTDVALLNVRDTIPFNSRGTISYNSGGDCGGVTCTALANFVDNFTGPSGSASIVSGSPVIQPFDPSYAVYLQDSWRLKSNLTADLGLRYEYWGTVENILRYPAIDTSAGFGVFGSFPQTQAFGQQPQKMNWGPRAGLAYTPGVFKRFFGDGKTVIRLGYGIFYDGLFTNILDNTAGTPPNVAGGTLQATTAGRGLAGANGLLSQVAPVASPFGAVNTIASNLLNPRTDQWNFNIERELPGNFVLTTAYVGTRGEHLYVNTEYNPLMDGTARLNPARGSIVARTNGGDSSYNGFNVKLDRRFSKGLLLRGAYTWSKLMDNGSEVFAIGNTSFAMNPFNQSQDRGPSAYDRRHRFILTYVWDLPYFHDASGFAMRALNGVIRDWQVSGTYTIQSGIPGYFTANVDMNGDGRSTNDRPILGNPAAPLTAVGQYTKSGQLIDFNTGNPTTPDAVHFLLYPAGYFPTATGPVGAVGRDTYYSPNAWYADMAIQRTIRTPMKGLEGAGLTIRGEFFDIFNHPNQGLPSLNVQASDLLNLDETWTGGRTIKIWLKFNF